MKTIWKHPSPLTDHAIGRHGLFWLVILGAFTIAKSSTESPQQDVFSLLANNAINLIAPFLAATLLNDYLLPGLFQRKKYAAFLLLFSLSAYLVCVLARIMNVHVAEPLFRNGHFRQESIAQIFLQIRPLLQNYFPVCYFIAFTVTSWKQQKAQADMRQRNAELEGEKTRTELNFLKAQIHPHFLFNTLNNLYVLTLKKSDQAPETVVKLSAILDYILYKGKETLVPLEKEIQLLENYIALEKLRFGEELRVSFHQEVDDARAAISPMLLLALVENAFKHGASSQPDNPEIRIALRVRDHFLVFEVFNSRSGHIPADEPGYRQGIGVSNVRRQLALLYGEYSFEVEPGNSDYRVKLSINLRNLLPQLPA